MNHKKNQTWKNRLTDHLYLPKDLILGESMISITGHQELFIENYRGILSYASTEIKVSLKHGFGVIQGESLMIVYYTNDDMKISGIIKTISFDQ